MRLKVKLIPNSSRDEVCGWLGDALKIKVRAVTESGKANEAMLKLLAYKLGIRRDQLTLVSGSCQPRKAIRINKVAEEHVLELLK